MTLMDRLFGTKTKADQSEARELEEWDYHHNSGMQSYNEEFFNNLWMTPPTTIEGWRAAEQKANHLIGHRAPADYAEFLAFGYARGRIDALMEKPR